MTAKEYQDFIMKQLENMDLKLDTLTEHVTTLRIEVARLKTKSALAGGVAGLVITVAAKFLLSKFGV